MGVIAVVASTTVAALDQTIVNTIMPSVIGDLGGIELYAWVFSSYLLLLTVATPICGRLADLLGRKPVYLAGLAVFVAGSALAGQSQSVEQLIAFRALQGLGAGALLPVGSTVIGDLFDMRMRARLQGFFSSIWLTAALAGPPIGGVLAETLSWRWAFYVNVPIGALAAALLIFALRETQVRREGALDWRGALLLSSATVSLLLALNGTQPALLAPGAVLLAIVFVRLERATLEPLIDLSLIRVPVIKSGLAVNAMIGVILFSVATYLPPFVQGVLGARPVEVGAVVTAMSLGWSGGAVTMGLILLRIGLRRSILAGTLFVLIGTTILATMGRDAPLIVPAAAAFASGLGIGFTATANIVGAQGAVRAHRRGIVTSLMLFMQSLGAAIGVGGLGTLLNFALGPRAAEVGVLLDREARPGIDPLIADELAELLAGALHQIYLVLVVLAVLVVLLAWRLTRAIPERPEQLESGRDADRAAAAGSYG